MLTNLESKLLISVLRAFLKNKSIHTFRVDFTERRKLYLGSGIHQQSTFGVLAVFWQNFTQDTQYFQAKMKMIN